MQACWSNVSACRNISNVRDALLFEITHRYVMAQKGKIRGPTCYCRLAELLRHSVREVQGSNSGWVILCTMSTTARHCCDVSSDLLALPRRCIPPLVTFFLLLVKLAVNIFFLYSLIFFFLFNIFFFYR